MPANNQTELLREIDAKLSALVVLQTHQLLRDDPDLADPRPRTIDKILSDAGLKQADIATILGKTPQAVGQILRKETK